MVKKEQDLYEIIRQLTKYIEIIKKDYGSMMREETLSHFKNSSNQLVEFNSSNTISFIVRDGKLYLPQIAYHVFDILKKEPNYGKNRDDGKKPDEYLNTDTTYLEYINHAILSGMETIDYFEESLLHEAMHLCGSGGGDPLQEGINELKTRELAQKYKLKISGYGYPKETKIAQMLQNLIGKDNMDKLTFLSYKDRLEFLQNNVGNNFAILYEDVSNEMKKASNNYNAVINNVSSPIEKATKYDSIDYSNVYTIINSYHKNLKR